MQDNGPKHVERQRLLLPIESGLRPATKGMNSQDLFFRPALDLGVKSKVAPVD
jgi:hypothetical protein